MPQNTERGAKALQEGPGAGTERRSVAPAASRATFLVDAVSLSKVQGRPFLVSEIEAKIDEILRVTAVGAPEPPQRGQPAGIMD